MGFTQLMICGVKSTSVIVASSSKGAPLSVIFDCSFLLPLVPSEISTLQFSVLSHPADVKKSRPLGVLALFSLPDARSHADAPESGFTFRAARY
ncbi:unnamed protein product [Cylicocyclus nassatus]|uniref:Uncharacterized protein n=1 Tax=Cylicocyclus nassatus TaxID=53992 RepID=A0AA36H8A1_CYLNA|nr:unnamed protein product [Cylicocyclus nassatus]